MTWCLKNEFPADWQAIAAVASSPNAAEPAAFKRVLAVYKKPMDSQGMAATITVPMNSATM